MTNDQLPFTVTANKQIVVALSSSSAKYRISWRPMDSRFDFGLVIFKSEATE